MACGSKEFDPPFPFPQGQAGAGMVPPTRRTLRASQTRWHASMQPLPPQEEFQTAPLKPPLRDPPEGLSRCTALPPARWSDDHRTQKKIRKGRHVGLDFYDLLIEDDKVWNRLISDGVNPRPEAPDNSNYR
jgi:hypothetical protein